jgi:hypothetical protein
MPPKTLRLRFPYVRPFVQQLRLIASAGAAGTVSMLLAFFFIQFLMRDLSLVSAPEPKRVSEANELRTVSNQLVDLAAEFLSRTAVEGSSQTPEFGRWRSTSFQPRIKTLREQIEGSASQTELLTQLLDATDKLLAVAATPEQPHLRRQVADDVLQATGDVESWIAENNLGTWLSEPGHIPAFAGSR